MKDNRFKLTAVLALALLAAGVALGAAAGRFQATKPAGAGGANDVGNNLGIDCDLLLTNVIGRWQQTDGLTADIQWQVNLVGHPLKGVGQYTQTGRGTLQRHGILLKGGDPAAPMILQQAVLASQPILWTQWQSTIEQAASMVRLDQITMAHPEMPRAGIAHLIWRLQHAYQFDQAERIVEGKRQFLLLHGSRRGARPEPDSLVWFLGEDADRVSLLLDAASGFPHHIEWQSVESSRPKTLVTIKLVNVRAGVSTNEQLLAPKTFVTDAQDQTQVYLQAISAKAGGPN